MNRGAPDRLALRRLIRGTVLPALLFPGDESLCYGMPRLHPLAGGRC